jgi:small subunit ribosomal protein S1
MAESGAQFRAARGCRRAKQDGSMMNGEQTAVVDEQGQPDVMATSHEAPPAMDESATVADVAPETVAPETVAAPGDAAASTPDGEVCAVASCEADATITVAPPAEASAPPPSEEPPRRRIQLNPTATPEQLRPIPTYGESTEPPVAAPAATTAAAAETVAAVSDAIVTPRAAPVALPPKNAPLEAALEAEINAALAGTMSAPAAPVDATTPGAPPVPASEEDLVPGAQLKAKVQSVTADNVFCDVGFRVPGILPARQFPQGKQPRVGEEFLVIADKFDPENGVIQVNLPKATRRPRGNWEELSIGQIVECIVNKTNKGGLEVTVSNMRAFLPASQVDLGFVSSLEAYVGQKFLVQITEVNPSKRNLVVSRRVLLIQERKEAAAVFWQKVEVGQQFNGTVKTIKDYGAFIDLGGVDGFLHVGEMSWTRIKHPSDILQEGAAVDVVILSLDREKQKIGLGMRQLAQNPWSLAADKYAVGRTVSGKVTRVTDFGAFVELEPGVEGLIHISELDHRRVKRVADVLNAGQDVQAQVLEVLPDRQRISLSLKALKEKPEAPKDEDLAPGKGQGYDRKRKEPLRGGTGAAGGSGLFGNPGDFGR